MTRLGLPRWLVVTVLLLVGLAWFAGTATRAEAHEFRPALLRIEEDPNEPGRYALRLVPPPVSEAGVIGPGELSPIVPPHCQLRPRSELAFVVDCGAEGLIGPVGVAGLERHGVDVLVDLRYADATRVTTVLGPDQPTLTIEPGETRGPGAVLGDYLALGLEHILLGIDHLLFVLGLVLLVGVADLRRVIATITAFTVAHSITLALATLELVELPSAPVEACIALSIVLLARELALGPGEHPSATWRWPWLVAFGFGLIHGFGFAGALREIGLPPSQSPLALLGFNLGVEAGQLGVVAALLLASAGLRAVLERLDLGPEAKASARKLATRLAIWAMGSVAFAWTLERVLGFWS